ncbi:MAG: ABC transporter permease [Clostridia bacterium]|nr:ABC transporter permease [Clostridia bacterium]
MVNNRQAIKNGVSGVYLAIILLLIYAPILLLLFASFSSARIIGEGGTFSFEWYIQLFQSERVMGILLNTVLLAVIAATLSTVLGTMGAIGIFYSNKRTSALLQGANQIPVVNAEIVTALALAILFAAVTLQRTYFSLVVGHLVLCTPFVLISVIPKLKQMDNNLYEAALDLGASPTQALFRVVIPQIASGIISGFMLSITLSLDDYIITSFTKPATFDTLSTYVYNAVKNESKSDLPLIRALSAIVFLIMIIVVVVLIVKSSRKEEQSR